MTAVSSTLKGSKANAKKSAQFVGFRLADQGYLFPIGQIQEIVILGQVTKTPQVADYVEGVSNLRGTIIPIINLRRLFGLDPKSVDDQRRTIVVNVGARTIGCTVDAVTQVVRIADEDIKPAPDLIAGAGTPWIAGFAKQEESLLIVLNINELLDPEKLGQVRKAVEASGLLNLGTATSATDEPTTKTS